MNDSQTPICPGCRKRPVAYKGWCWACWRRIFGPKGGKA